MRYTAITELFINPQNKIIIIHKKKEKKKKNETLRYHIVK